MNNIYLLLEYDGSRYGGWQRLGKGETDLTIENKLAEVITKMTGKAPELNVGSRTESGVHAYGQVVNFKTDYEASCIDIKHYLNRYLPMDIAVLEVKKMPERFHASLNAKSRTYSYHIAIGDVPSVFERKYRYYSFKTPDVNKMKSAAGKLIGKHDFKNFTSAKRNKSTVREMTECSVYADNSEIIITMTANDFLHNMARIIAGTLLEIGLGERPEGSIEKLLKETSKEEAAMPAKSLGMFLESVSYGE